MKRWSQINTKLLLSGDNDHKTESAQSAHHRPKKQQNEQSSTTECPNKPRTTRNPNENGTISKRTEMRHNIILSKRRQHRKRKGSEQVNLLNKTNSGHKLDPQDFKRPCK